MKPIAFKISDQLAERLAETYGNRNRGAQRAVESWNDLQIFTLFELRKMFSVNELKFLMKFINRRTFVPSLASDIDLFCMEIQKFEEQFNEEIKIDYEELNNKLVVLTASQIFFLCDWANRFCLDHHIKTCVEDYISFLAKESK